MKNTAKFGVGVAAAGMVLTLSACGSSDSKDAKGKTDVEKSAAIVTDIGGVDDRSFNQSAWEGLQKWGKSHDLKKGVGGYDYLQSQSAADYKNNLDKAVQAKYKTIFGVGYLLKDAVAQTAKQNPNNNFVIIDDVIEGQKNVASAVFNDNEAAYLAGVAAAYTTKTNKVGFIGGEEGAVIDRFQAGFEQGVKDGAKQLHKNITVDVKYANSFGAPDKGKALAAQIYKSGADIIYHASGGTGAGVFQEAKSLNEKTTSDKKVWVIGVDSDQQAEGKYKNKDGKEDNCTLTSTIKGVNIAVEKIANDAWNNKFPGGKTLSFGLKDNGVSITKGFLSDKAQKAVDQAKKSVVDGKVKVAEHPEK